MHQTIHVISLSTAHQRRQHIEKLFKTLNASFKFFDAVNKENLSEVLANHPIIFKQDSLTHGEMGCFMSHYLLWQKMLDTNMPYMVIVEDDVILSHKTHMMLNHLDKIMSQCDILKFETMNIPVLLEDRCTDERITYSFELKQLKSEHWGTAGYVITNTFAKRLCNLLSKDVIKRPIDHIIFEDMLNNSYVLQTIPAFSIQEDVLNKNNASLISGLEKDRNIRKNQKVKLPLSVKFQRELYRILRVFSIRYWKDKKERNMLVQEIQNRAVVIDFEE